MQKTQINKDINMLTNDSNREEERLKTFNVDWPHAFISTRILEKTGFYYIGPHDQVKCFFCGTEVASWEVGDNEVIEHRRWSPNCPLLKRRNTSNVPMDTASDLNQLLSPVAYNVHKLCVTKDRISQNFQLNRLVCDHLKIGQKQ